MIDGIHIYSKHGKHARPTAWAWLEDPASRAADPAGRVNDWSVRKEMTTMDIRL